MKKNYKKIKQIFQTSLFLFLLFFPLSIISAQSIELQSEDGTFAIGDSFLIKVILNSNGNQINSLGGIISIPSDLFDVVAIETGNSLISLWTESPKYIENEGKINFSGGLIGGYSGTSEPVFSFILQAKKEGSGKIFFEEFDAFLNDGKGTLLSPIKIENFDYIINKKSVGGTRTYFYEEDLNAPEIVALKIGHDPFIEEDKTFISFFATDKDSGILKFEIEEKPWLISFFGYKKVWSDAKNPQILKYQNWISTIKVRAVDVKGNIAEKTIIKPLKMNSLYYFSIMLLTLLAFIFYIKAKKRV